MKDRTQTIFGNIIDQKTIRKAERSKEKYLRKYGDDSGAGYLFAQEDIPALVQALCRGDGRPGTISGFVTLDEEDCAKIYQMMV